MICNLLLLLLLLCCFALFVDCIDEIDSVFRKILLKSDLYRAALLKWRPQLSLDRFVELTLSRADRADNELSSVRADDELSNIVGLFPHSTMLPMRDGVKLFTVYAQPDIIQERRDTVIIRSPYGPDATENIALLWYPFGFNVVMQNERGTGLSEGNFTFWQTAADDGAWTLTVSFFF